MAEFPHVGVGLGQYTIVHADDGTYTWRATDNYQGYYTVAPDPPPAPPPVNPSRRGDSVRSGLRTIKNGQFEFHGHTYHVSPQLGEAPYDGRLDGIRAVFRMGRNQWKDAMLLQRFWDPKDHKANRFAPNGGPFPITHWQIWVRLDIFEG